MNESLLIGQLHYWKLILFVCGIPPPPSPTKNANFTLLNFIALYMKKVFLYPRKGSRHFQAFTTFQSMKLISLIEYHECIFKSPFILKFQEGDSKKNFLPPNLCMLAKAKFMHIIVQNIELSSMYITYKICVSNIIFIYTENLFMAMYYRQFSTKIKIIKLSYNFLF